MKKNDVLFYGMAYLIKSEKRDSEKAKYWMQMPLFFQKSGVFLQISCKIFQNEHEKAIQMKKTMSFFMVWLML
jgi:ketosteroid isomerase-like protein